jgi:xanthine dehydrogenase YagS FAD-binding subunit
MQPFNLVALSRGMDAVELGAATNAALVAGGTNVVDFMRTGAMRASTVIDIDALPLRGIDVDSQRLRIGALSSMSEVAADSTVREQYRFIA